MKRKNIEKVQICQNAPTPLRCLVLIQSVLSVKLDFLFSIWFVNLRGVLINKTCIDQQAVRSRENLNASKIPHYGLLEIFADDE